MGAPDGKPVVHSLPRISDTAVADLLQVIRARLLRYLVRRHVVEDDEGQTRFLADDLAEREPALAQLAAAAVSGLPPAGPELRRNRSPSPCRLPMAPSSCAPCASRTVDSLSMLRPASAPKTMSAGPTFFATSFARPSPPSTSPSPRMGSSPSS